MGYCTYCLWALNCLATLCYSIIPSLCLLRGITMFPKVSSPWFFPFAYVIFSKYTYSLAEFLFSGGTVLGWWNDQCIWLLKRTSSYLFAFIDTILNLFGFSDMTFVISDKVADQDVSQRYEKEMMEFGTSSRMFTILATIALLNLFCFLTVVKKAAMDVGTRVYETMGLQILLCGLLVLINLPLYHGLFLRKDKGKMPTSLTADMDRFVDDGSLDDNIESFLSPDDADPRDIVGQGGDVRKGFTFLEIQLLPASTKVECCHFSSDGKLLATGGHDKKAVLWCTKIFYNEVYT